MTNSEFSDLGMGQIRKFELGKFRSCLTSFSEICISDFSDLGIRKTRKLGESNSKLSEFPENFEFSTSTMMTQSWKDWSP